MPGRLLDKDLPGIVADLRRGTVRAAASGVSSAGLLPADELFTATAGANTTYELVYTPYDQSERVFLNGLCLRRTTDYTVDGAVVTVIPTLTVSDVIDVHYWRGADDLPVPLLPISDDFNRADGTAFTTTSSGDAWEILIGAWQTIGNRARCVTNPGIALAVVETNASDLQIVCDTPTAQTNSMGVVFRLTDASNYLSWASSDGLQKREAGVVTGLGGGTGWSDGDTVTIRLHGDSIVVLRNGAAYASITNTFNQSATKHGLRVGHSAASADAKWDNLAMTVYP